MIEAVKNDDNDYCRGFGHPKLVKSIAELYSKPFQRELDPLTEVMVTPGAIGALACFILALVNKGDEIVCFEPAFPRYFEDAQIANGTLKTIPLEVNE
jgi:kynurenine--oxoglutarate transaminase/cysteine-S-conjugate beta-lyase/glutamine--phenylpyruvate transaminase